MQDVLAEAALVLGEVIPTDYTKVWDLLWKTDKLRFRIGMALADATKALSERRLRVLLPKDPSVTDLDRTTTQLAGSADQDASVQRLTLTLDLLASRVGLLHEYVLTLHSGSKED